MQRSGALDRDASLPRRDRLVVVAAAVVLAAVFAVAQLRHGVLPTWDTVSYWSGAEAIRHGDLFGSHLQPSFSNFSVIDFLERDGRLPFVDFPVGYPLLIAGLGIVIGTKGAMAVWTIAGVAAVVALITVGPAGKPGSRLALATRAVVALGLIATSPFRVVTRAGMTEPLFCAVVLGLVLALLAYRETGAAWPGVVALAIIGGLLRFMGASLALLVFAERRRRTRRTVESLAWAAVVALPAVVNALWASRAGGGHSARLHGIDGSDTERFARSIGGWLDARHANVALTFFTDEGARWWAWALAVVWIGALVVVGLSMCGVRIVKLPAELELCFAAAGILTVALAIGMVSFDDLVNPDNRVMLPMGVVSITGLVWSLDRLPLARPRLPRAAALGIVAVWLAGAVFPRGIGDPYFPTAREPVTTTSARASGASVIVTTDADFMHWYTGLPAAYPPKAYFELTGETVDLAEPWAELPCALERANGVLVVPAAGGFFGFDPVYLDELVAAGSMIPEPDADATVYRPAPDIC